jgi:hypothetical protein
VKKFLAILFTVLYITAASGTPLYLQYCKGQLVDLNIGLGESADCDNCPFENADQKCCDVKQQQLQADEFNHTSAVSLTKVFIQAVVPETFFRIVVPPISAIQVDHPTSNGPPVAGKIALHIKNCTFRI